MLLGSLVDANLAFISVTSTQGADSGSYIQLQVRGYLVPSCRTCDSQHYFILVSTPQTVLDPLSEKRPRFILILVIYRQRLASI